MDRIDLSSPKLAINGGNKIREKSWADNITTGEEEKIALSRVIDSGYLSLFEGSHTPDTPFSFHGGPEVQALENEWNEYYGSKYSVSVNSATSGLYMAIGALGIGYGDEVIVSPYTMSACAMAPMIYGAIPVFADVDDMGSLDPKSIKTLVSPRTKAILVVHQFGIPAQMNEIMEIANEYNLKVIEDCAQAHGAMFKNQKVGSFGDIGCFSFYGNKVLTTGEGGMCTTNNPILNKKMRILRDHGMSREKKYWHDMVGFNYRMTNLQAAIGVAQLERIESIHKNRREYENCYRAALSKKNFTFQNNLNNRQRITWLVSFLMDEDVNREEYIANLKEKGIDARPFFYLLSDMEIYKEYCSSGTPVAKKISSLGLNLPTYESLKSIVEINSIFSNV